jgi:hypothetical protein
MYPNDEYFWFQHTKVGYDYLAIERMNFKCRSGNSKYAYKFNNIASSKSIQISTAPCKHKYLVTHFKNKRIRKVN